MFMAAREPSPDWVAACRSVAPPTDRMSHLTIRWVPGTREQPVQRWVVFECIPRAAVDTHPIMELVTPESGDAMVRWAWDYLQRTGTLPVGCWVVQGNGGGHPVSWTRAEQVLADAGVLEPAVLPVIGALPYAEPDHRTWTALRQRSHLNRRLVDAHEARLVARAMAEQAARAADVAATEERMRAAMDEVGRVVYDTARHVDATERRHVGGLVTEDDMARYIETGDYTLDRT